jgi:hypothetical protein
MRLICYTSIILSRSALTQHWVMGACNSWVILLVCVGLCCVLACLCGGVITGYVNG